MGIKILKEAIIALAGMIAVNAVATAMDEMRRALLPGQQREGGKE